MTKNWVAVYEGEVFHAKILQAELEGNGIPAVVPDPQVIAPDPNIMGLPTEAGCVLVPLEYERPAREIVERVPARAPRADEAGA